MANNFASMDDIERLFRELKPSETEKADKLLEVVSDSLRYEAAKVGKDLDKMIQEIPSLRNVAKSVTVDVVGRALMTSTDTEPTTQFAQSGLGYSVSGSYLVPGGGLFIKNSELARLGLKSQGVKLVEMYDKGNSGSPDQ